jgi:hypothetical protein
VPARWSVKGMDLERWECDDQTDSGSNTLHQIWIKLAE